MNKFRSILKIVEWEAIFWLIGLGYLFLIDPYEIQHFTLCPFHNIGITFCPGCGLGRSISFFYHADLINSFRTHPLGITAFVLITIRTAKLFAKTINNYNKSEEVMYG
ncbi:MAG: DUF2752 domain-containing protein [Melioribacteraceae bacterium]